MTQEQAVKLYESKFWEGMSFRERAVFQMNEKRLCMPFGVFQEAVEKAIGRPVWTHEFGMNLDGLKAELAKATDPPTPVSVAWNSDKLNEIMGLIPAEKRLVVMVERTPEEGTE